MAHVPSCGQSRPNWAVCTMSGLPPLATELPTLLVVRFVPGADCVNRWHASEVAKAATQAVKIDEAWSLSGRLISRNSRSVRSVSASSTDQTCRHCSGRRKSRASRDSATRHHTRNNEEPGQYTKGAVRGSPNAASHLSGRKVECCCSAADGSPAGSRVQGQSRRVGQNLLTIRALRALVFANSVATRFRSSPDLRTS